MSKELDFIDQGHFKDWLELNLHSMSWEGRYSKELEDFWLLLFPANISLDAQFLKIDQVNSHLVKGPLIAWVNWIKFKLVCYLFIHKDFTIRDLANISKIPVSEVSLALRNFMIERYPHLEEFLNSKFQIGNILSENLDLSFKGLVDEFGFEVTFKGSLEDEVLTGLEVTLYPDWKRAYSFLKSSIKQKKKMVDYERIKNSKNKKKFIAEVLFLFALASFLIFSIKVINKVYEDYLVEKISIYSPDFFWLDKNLSFKPEYEISQAELEIKYNELEELERIESRQVFSDVSSTQRFEVESDVVLTSIDTLPKDIASANLEQSDYEEVKKGGYRNVRYGRRKAYRVMMTSFSPTTTKKELISMLKKYNISQVDNVKPGTQIPGGIYFNLYVPHLHLKEFLSKVTAKEKNATILESKTIYGAPPGSNRVFIWVKNI